MSLTRTRCPNCITPIEIDTERGSIRGGEDWAETPGWTDHEGVSHWDCPVCNHSDIARTHRKTAQED